MKELRRWNIRVILVSLLVLRWFRLSPTKIAINAMLVLRMVVMWFDVPVVSSSQKYRKMAQTNCGTCMAINRLKMRWIELRYLQLLKLNCDASHCGIYAYTRVQMRWNKMRCFHRNLKMRSCASDLWFLYPINSLAFKSVQYSSWMCLAYFAVLFTIPTSHLPTPY